MIEFHRWKTEKARPKRMGPGSCSMQLFSARSENKKPLMFRRCRRMSPQFWPLERLIGCLRSSSSELAIRAEPEGKPHEQFLWGRGGNGPGRTLGTAPVLQPTQQGFNDAKNRDRLEH